ncbi:MAG: hypothetical protein K9H49_03340 [Bacteroidales bacterium]|nr:hypothetical protein [Bacteroidales bacterium]MCF8390890.1 hypothetical protein [Bacteroidales bacterium]
MKNSWYIKSLLISVIILTSNISCDKHRFEFPYAPISLNVDLVNIYSTIGLGQHAFVYENEGVNGLIIFRNHSDELFVFDRTCTYEPDHSCSVENDTTSFLHLSCPCCESQYFLDESGDAFVTRGPSRYSLVRYNAFINGGFLRITN